MLTPAASLKQKGTEASNLCKRAAWDGRLFYSARLLRKLTDVNELDEQLTASLEGQMLVELDHEITVAHRDRVHLLL